MMRIPLNHENGVAAELRRELNALKEEVRSLRLGPSPDVRIKRTSLGTLLEIVKKTEAAIAPSTFQWKGEWKAATDYTADDLVIRGSTNKSSLSWNDAGNILLSGYKAGLFIARKAAPSGTPAPEEPQTTATEEFWETVARGSWPQLHILTKGSANAIRMKTAGSTGSVTVDLSACGGHDLSIKEIEVCVGGVTRHARCIISDPY